MHAQITNEPVPRREELQPEGKPDKSHQRPARGNARWIRSLITDWYDQLEENRHMPGNE